MGARLTAFLRDIAIGVRASGRPSLAGEIDRLADADERGNGLDTIKDGRPAQLIVDAIAGELEQLR